MKIALCGTWHVHARDYFEKALALGEISGVYEKNEAWRKDFCKRYGVKEFTTFEELLSSDAEGVIVCTATNEHIDVIPKIAAAKKHIFTEKVLGLNEAECRIMEKAIKENGVKFVISLPFKYRGAMIAIKEIVCSGELGKINYARFRNVHSGAVDNWLPPHFYDKTECGGGAMIDLGAHGMYITDWLFGLPEKYSSAFTVCTGKEVEDNAVTVMTYPDGLIALNETGFVSTYYPMSLEIGGSDGYLRYASGTLVKATRKTQGEVKVDIPADKELPIVQFLTNKIEDGCGIEDAIHLSIMMEKAYKNIM